MRKYFSLAALLGGALGVLALILFGQIPGEGRWASELGNSAHGPAFAILTLISIALLRRVPKRHATILSDYPLAIAAGLILGALVEALQFVTGRDASFDDLLRDGLGALAATGFFAALDPRVHVLPRRNTIQRTGIVVGAVSTAIIIAPLVVTGAAYLQRNRNFPTLVNFNSPLSTYFLGVYSAVTVKRGALPSNVPGGEAGAVGLHVRLAGEGDWALALWEPRPDWRGYDRVRLEIANPTDDPLRIDLRIRDKDPHHDRRNGDIGTIEVAPRSRKTVTVKLPQARASVKEMPIDFTAIYGFVLKRNSANQSREFYLMRIWLE